MIDLNNLCLQLRGFALDNINLNIEQGDYYIILGPTGSGKTLLLETIAGIRTPTEGELVIEGRSVVDVPVEQRGIGIVYQHQALFPHLTVRENITFGMKVRKIDRALQEQKLKWLSGLFGIEGFLDRNPVTLSGGERQKVALARALAVCPKILLLDEPLSSLDPENREMIQQELRRLHRDLDITVVHVTHDFQEAISLGQKIAMLNKGRICQMGTPDEVFLRPSSLFSARYTMCRNITAGKMRPGTNIFITGSGLELEVADKQDKANYACIRPELIRLVTCEQKGASNQFQGTVIDVENKGIYYVVKVSAGLEWVCYLQRAEGLNIQRGQKIWLTSPPESIHLFCEPDVD